MEVGVELVLRATLGVITKVGQISDGASVLLFIDKAITSRWGFLPFSFKRVVDVTDHVVTMITLGHDSSTSTSGGLAGLSSEGSGLVDRVPLPSRGQF